MGKLSKLSGTSSIEKATLSIEEEAPNYRHCMRNVMRVIKSMRI
jgi:hypothetical protein